jgi:16S rRNA (cytidine1402-2'-O)-methyltransferase
VIATPLGNLGDLSPRAVEALAACDVVACEDTRRTRILLARGGARGRAVSYHRFNEAARIDAILAELASGRTVGLVTDAGTPGVSDPGARLVAAARRAGARIEGIPGPCAPVAALSLSGFESGGFVFAGFPPARGGPRRRFLRALRAAEEARAAADPEAEPWPIILFEAPHRIEACLEDLARELGDRPAVALREMTKLHEETLAGTVRSIRGAFAGRPPRGEFTLVVAGRAPSEPPRPGGTAPESGGRSALELKAAYEALLASGVDRREALRRLARRAGIRRNALYELLLAAGGEEGAG